MGMYDLQEKMIAEKDARIAELTAEIGDLKATVISLIATRTELTAERDRYKHALERIASDRTNGLPAIHSSETPRIARNALKEG